MFLEGQIGFPELEKRSWGQMPGLGSSKATEKVKAEHRVLGERGEWEMRGKMKVLASSWGWETSVAAVCRPHPP